MNFSSIHNKAHQGAVYTLEPGKPGNFFSGGSDGHILLWDAGKLEVLGTVAKVNGTVLSVAYHEASGMLVAGTLSGSMHLLDLVAKKEIRHISFHKNGVFSFVKSADRLLSAGGDGVLAEWDFQTLELRRALKLSDKSLRCMDIHPGFDLMAVGSSDTGITQVSMHRLEVLNRLEGHTNSVFSVKYHPEGNRLISGSRDAHLGIWSLGHEQKMTDYIPAHNYTINSIAWHKSRPVFATASRDKSIKLWNADAGFLLKLDANSGGHINSVNSILWMNDNLFSAGDDRDVLKWEFGFD